MVTISSIIKKNTWKKARYILMFIILINVVGTSRFLQIPMVTEIPAVEKRHFDHQIWVLKI